MREDCKYFQLRVHASGDETRFCALRLAPEAPWRCPVDCGRYVQLVEGPPRRPQAEPPVHPAGAGARGSGAGRAELHPDAVELLTSAEDILGAVRPEIEAERRRQRQEEQRRERSVWNRLKRQSSRWRR